MKSLELTNYGVVEMSFEESIVTEGSQASIGKKWGPWGAVAWLAQEIVSNWDDIKQGFDDATSHKPPVYKK